jgi:pimeloyl-ACP methyl ester carboxylesterase
MKLLKLALASLIVSAFAVTVSHAKPAEEYYAKNIVLIHGAWADGSSYDKVIPLLQAKGLNVIAVQNPLTSLADSSAATTRALNLMKGPTVLVGHSWGGMVITDAGMHPNVSALVYIAAFAPMAGESAMDLAGKYPVAPGFNFVLADASGFTRLSEEGMMKNFVPDLPAAQSRVMLATQGETKASVFGEKAGTVAWKDKASWYVIAAQDRMIQPDLETEMAKNINAKTSTVNSGHVPMQSQAKAIAKVILEAAKAVPAPAPLP